MPPSSSSPQRAGSRRERWRRIARVALLKLREGPGPLWRALRNGVFTSLPRRLQFWLRRGSLRRFRAFAELRFAAAEPGVERPGLVSVILPVFNQADLLGEAVASVLGQTYRELELIVLDDGSGDDVAAALQRFAGDPRLRLLRQPNQGLPKALTSAFECALGEFHTWTSADNVMHAMQLQRLVGHLQAHPEQAMVFADYELIDDAGQPLRSGDFRILDRIDRNDLAVVRVDRPVPGLHLIADNFVGPCFVYRGRATRLLAGYGAVMGLEDYDYWLRLSRLLGLAHLGDRAVLYRYRVHANTLSAKARELRLQAQAQELLARERRRAAWFAAPAPLHVDRSSLRWVREVASGWPVHELSAVSPLPADARGLCLRAADDAEPDPDALPAGVTLAITFADEAQVWRHGARVRGDARVALCGDAAIARRLAVFTRAVFVAADARERLELALRHHADRSFAAVHGTGAALERAVPFPVRVARTRLRLVGNAPQALADALVARGVELVWSAAQAADVTIAFGTAAGAAKARAAGERFVVVLAGAAPLSGQSATFADRAEVAAACAWCATSPDELAQLDASLRIEPERLLLVPAAAPLAEVCAHVAGWLLQNGELPGLRGHIARLGAT